MHNRRITDIASQAYEQGARAGRTRKGGGTWSSHSPIGRTVQFFIDNLLLIAVAFVSGAMLVWPFVRARASGPSLSTLQATQLIN